VCQKLLHYQLGNYTSVLRWLRQLLGARLAFLQQHRHVANVGAHEPIVAHSALKLEVP